MTTNPPAPPPFDAAPAPDRWRVGLALFLLYTIWSSTYLGMKIALATFDPMVLGAVRFLTAGVLLFAIHLARGGRLPTRREVLAAVAPGLLLFVAGNGFIAIAQHEVASGVTAIVASTAPLWAALLAPLFGERARRAEWIGVALGTIGVALLAVESDLGSDWRMVLVLLLAPLGWSLGAMFARKLPQAPGGAGPALQMMAGGGGMALIALVIGAPWPATVSGETWGVIAYLVVFGSLVGFSAFAWLLKNTRPTLALSYSYVNPGIAVLLGVVFGHEPLHPTTLAATAVLALAVAVVVRTAIGNRQADAAARRSAATATDRRG